MLLCAYVVKKKFALSPLCYAIIFFEKNYSLKKRFLCWFISYAYFKKNSYLLKMRYLSIHNNKKNI